MTSREVFLFKTAQNQPGRFVLRLVEVDFFESFRRLLRRGALRFFRRRAVVVPVAFGVDVGGAQGKIEDCADDCGCGDADVYFQILAHFIEKLKSRNVGVFETSPGRLLIDEKLNGNHGLVEAVDCLQISPLDFKIGLQCLCIFQIADVAALIAPTGVLDNGFCVWQSRVLVVRHIVFPKNKLCGGLPQLALQLRLQIIAVLLLRQNLQWRRHRFWLCSLLPKNRNADAQLNALKTGRGVVVHHLSVHFLRPGKRLDEIAARKIGQLFRFEHPFFGFRQSDLLLGKKQKWVVFRTRLENPKFPQKRARKLRFLGLKNPPENSSIAAVSIFRFQSTT
jgi:hypothetical protein